MRRVLIRYSLLLIYIVAMAIYFYPKGASLSQGEGLRWLLTLSGAIGIIALLIGLQYYRIRWRQRIDKK